MTDSNTNQQIKLKDGRMLGYDEYGTPEGKPVFFFHGFPQSRLDWVLFDPDGKTAAELNARIIAVDRPGPGLSDFKRGRKLLDWPDDVVELADNLLVDSFAVLGISGGGPYAAACAFKISERLTATSIVCGMGPSESPGMKNGTSWTYPGKSLLIRRVLLWFTAIGLRKQPDKFKSQVVASFSGPDKALMLEHTELVNEIVGSWQEAFRSGIASVHHESTLYTRPWQFRLQDIAGEVHLWHGDQDDNVPISVGRYVADAIPNCHATFLENEGHFSLPYKYVREYLGVLVD